MKKLKIFAIITAIAILLAVVTAANTLINPTSVDVTPDGAVQFNTTGFEVNELAILEDEHTGYYDNATVYELKDSDENKITLFIHNSSMNDTNTTEEIFLRTDYEIPPPIWVDSYNGYYYMVKIDDYNQNDEYSSFEFVYDRIIDNREK